MSIKSMEFGPNGNETTVTNPSWGAAESILRELDGERNDSVALDSSGDSYMGISGGRDGCYVVAGFLEGFGSFICANGSEGRPAQDVVVAGDFNTYASENVVDLETAVRAAKVFFETGGLANDMKWEHKRRLL